jgi:hypothetical protein
MTKAGRRSKKGVSYYRYNRNISNFLDYEPRIDNIHSCYVFFFTDSGLLFYSITEYRYDKNKKS